MLHAPVVGLQAAEAQARLRGDGLDQPQHRVDTRHAAAALADVDLHQHRQAAAGRRRGHAQVGHLLRMVHAHAQAAVPGQLRQQRRLGGPAGLVADVDVGDASLQEGQRLAHLLAADAHRPTLQLRQRDGRCLVRLGMRAQGHAGGVGRGLHGIEIALEHVQVQHQGRGVDGGQGITDACGPAAGGAGPCSRDVQFGVLAEDALLVEGDCAVRCAGRP